MKKMIATFVALLFVCLMAKAQATLSATLERCGSMRVSVNAPKTSRSTQHRYFVYWLERQIAPSIWELTEKRGGVDTTVLFEGLAPGIYRVMGMEDKPERSIYGSGPIPSERVKSANVQIRFCTENRSTIPVGMVDAGDIVLFPNPVKETIHFLMTSGDVGSNASMNLYDVAGREVLQIGLTELEHFIDVRHLPNGIYHAKIFIENKIFVKQVVIAQ